MALIFLDSFEHYSAAQTHRKWNANSNANSIDSSNGRTGNGASIGTFGNISRTFLPELQSVCMGYAMRFNTYSGACQMSGTFSHCPNVSLNPQSDGRLYFGTDFGNSPPLDYVVYIGIWVYLEVYCQMTLIQVTPDPSPTWKITLSMAAHANEAAIGGWSVDSPIYPGYAPTGRGWSVFNAYGAGGSFNSSIDDVYLTDGEFLGDIKVGILYPNAPGDSTAWTPNPSAPNWQNNKETPADDDTTTVTASAVGQKDLYNLDDLPSGFTAQIKGVQAGWLLKKTDAGGAACRGVWKSGTTEIDQSHGLDVVGGDYYPSYTAYVYNLQAERSSIFTGADWTMTEINALQLGIKRTK